MFIADVHFIAECFGIHASPRATRFEVLEPIRQGVRHFGGFANDIASGLVLRHDHGSQYMSDHFQKEIAFLGTESDPASGLAVPEMHRGASMTQGAAGLSMRVQDEPRGMWGLVWG